MAKLMGVYLLVVLALAYIGIILYVTGGYAINEIELMQVRTGIEWILMLPVAFTIAPIYSVVVDGYWLPLLLTVPPAALGMLSQTRR